VGWNGGKDQVSLTREGGLIFTGAQQVFSYATADGAGMPT